MSVVEPYSADPILNMIVRYQANASTQSGPLSFTRAYMLNSLIMCTNGSTTSYRLSQAVRVNRITLVTSGGGAIEWRSTYGPSRTIAFAATSTTAAGSYTSSPPKDSLAGFWSTTGNNESEVLFRVAASSADLLTIHFSFVLEDDITNVAVTTVNAGTTGQVYRTFLDGPRAGSVWAPTSVTYIA
jgi:hypothetical protein